METDSLSADSDTMSFLDILRHRNSALNDVPSYGAVSSHESDRGTVVEKALDDIDPHSNVIREPTLQYDSRIGAGSNTTGVVGLQAQADAILDTDWTLGLDDFASLSGPTMEATQEYPTANPLLTPVLAFPDPTWALYGNMAIHASKMVPNPRYRGREAGQCFHHYYHNPTNTTSHSNQPIARSNQTSKTKKSKKRRMFESILPRKRRHDYPIACTESLIPRSPHMPIPHPITAPRQKTPVPTAPEAALKPDRMTSKNLNRLPSNKRLTRVNQTDWVQDWENTTSASQNLNDRGITRDVNIPHFQKRPMSWPLRQYIRRSLDLSVNALTKEMAKLNVDGGGCSPSPI